MQFCEKNLDVVCNAVYAARSQSAACFLPALGTVEIPSARPALYRI